MKRLTELFVTAVLAVCCTGRGLDPAGGDFPSGAEAGHDRIVLGRRLDDPYSVENMTKALETLYPTKAGRVIVPATHYYVRFLPADAGQYERLERLGVEMLDHPMDYEILREGDWYHDPDLPEEAITWQYAAVPKDFTFPDGIRCEILDSCHIPDEESSTKGADGIDWPAVEREAFRLTGNAGLLDGEASTKAGGSGTPAGRITIVDPDYGGGPEGVRGVRVACNCFVKTAHAYTDADGCYRMSRSFSSNPRYLPPDLPSGSTSCWSRLPSRRSAAARPRAWTCRSRRIPTAGCFRAVSSTTRDTTTTGVAQPRRRP